MIHRSAGGCQASGHSTSVVQRPTARKEAGSLAPPQVTIELCGHLSVSVDGRRCESDLPGRQGRLALAHLALNRSRAGHARAADRRAVGRGRPRAPLAGAQRRAVEAAARARPRRDRERRRAGRAAAVRGAGRLRRGAAGARRRVRGARPRRLAGRRRGRRPRRRAGRRRAAARLRGAVAGGSAAAAGGSRPAGARAARRRRPRASAAPSWRRPSGPRRSWSSGRRSARAATCS